MTTTPTPVTAYGVVIVRATSIDEHNARAVLERKVSALNDLTGDLIEEASTPWRAATPTEALAHHLRGTSMPLDGSPLTPEALGTMVGLLDVALRDVSLNAVEHEVLTTVFRRMGITPLPGAST